MNIRLSLRGDASLGSIEPALWSRLDDLELHHGAIWQAFLADRDKEALMASWTEFGLPRQDAMNLSRALRQAAFAEVVPIEVAVGPPPTDGVDDEIESPSAFAVLASAIDLTLLLTPRDETICLENLNAQD